MTALVKILAGGAVALMMSGVASASIIYAYQSTTLITTGPFVGDYDWSYIAQLSSDQQLSSSATDFAVVYDFMGAVSANTTNIASGLSESTVLQLTTSPQPFGQAAPDSPSLENINTTISGTLVPTGLTDLYDINIISTAAFVSGTFAYQSAQAEKYDPSSPSNGTETGNTALIVAPGTVVPEPVTLALVGGGLIGLGLLRRTRMNR